MDQLAEGMAAGLGGIICTTVLYPLEIVKNQLQVMTNAEGKREPGAPKPTFRSVALHIWKMDGARGPARSGPRWRAATHAATCCSRGPPACSGLPSRAEREREQSPRRPAAAGRGGAAAVARAPATACARPGRRGRAGAWGGGGGVWARAAAACFWEWRGA